MKRLFRFPVLFIIALSLFFSCEKDDNAKTSDNFDRAGMLTNIGNNIIIPDYESFSDKADLLNTRITEFTEFPSPNSLEAAQKALIEAYKSWEKVSVYEFGPGEEEMMRMYVNVFPTDPDQIGSNITSGDYDLTALINRDAIGLPAIDYLLFGLGTNNSEILNYYSSDEKAENRKKYLSDVSSLLKSKANTVYNKWIPSGGNYINTFVEAAGTDLGSSVGMLINQLNYDFEQIKTVKIGIPLGKSSFGVLYPSKTEAYYSDISKELAVINTEAIKNLFLGGTGAGFDDYLDYLNAEHSGKMLSQVIMEQLDTDIQKLNAIPDPLSGSLESSNSIVEEAYLELKKTVVLIKTDMPSAIGVLITYQDNDGD